MPKVATKATSPVLDKFETKVIEWWLIVTNGVGAVRAGTGFTLFIWSEDMSISLYL